MPANPNSFPKHDDYARTLFSEAVRHYQDALVLYKQKRYAGSITSSMKAVELGLKSLLMLDASTTIITEVFQTHRVFTEIMDRYDIYKTTHLASLISHNSELRRKIIELESLTPGKSKADKTNIENTINTEYPFFATDPKTPTVLHSPGLYFERRDGLTYLRTAWQTLRALRSIYPEIRNWQIPIRNP